MLDQFPRPLPELLRDVIADLEAPLALSMAISDPATGTQTPCVLVVSTPYDAYTWARMAHLPIAATAMGSFFAEGAVFALEVELHENPDSVVVCYTLLNIASSSDLNMLKLLASSERLGVGFADSKAMLQGIKLISWPELQRQEVTNYMEVAQGINAKAKAARRFDYSRAKDLFHLEYTKLRGPMRY